MTAEDVLQKTREVCDAAGWDRDEAEAKLRDKMRRSPALRTALADWACRHAVRIVVRGRRDELERGARRCARCYGPEAAHFEPDATFPRGVCMCAAPDGPCGCPGFEPLPPEC